MKNITFTLVSIVLVLMLSAQPPQSFKYQAVARDNAGNVIANQDVAFRISILQGSTAGYAVYVEMHNSLTNQFGLVNLEIGSGTVISGIFENILWRSGLYFLQIEMDAAGGTEYQLMGTTQLVSVPYSFYSGLSGGLVLTNENGDTYEVGVDADGNLTTTIINQWQTCGDELTDIRDGQKYSTVLIGSQCWMAENLNIGTRINGVDNMSNDGTIEKYCYGNLESNCDLYGGLYQWQEMMHYITAPGTQGICPVGWHVPKDHDWNVLEGFADSQYKIGNPVWYPLGWRGYDSGKNLKTTTEWGGGNGTDLYGFGVLPSGYRESNGTFQFAGADFWTSSKWNNDEPIGRLISGGVNNSLKNTSPVGPGQGFSLRCLKDYTNQPPAAPSSPSPSDGANNVGIDQDISWSCSDPDGNDLYYKVYFGANTTPPFVTAGLTTASYDPGTLNYNTTYYWKITAFDSYGDSAVGNVWSFTTLIEPVWACGDVLFDERDSQTYNTVQIGTQCWMAENLNIGNMINGSGNQTNNSIIEKYCYNNTASYCETHGGLYQWNEMMQYVTTPGVQGICLTGWHLPTDNEWCTLTFYIDATVNCNINGLSGTDAGTKMKSTTGWTSGGNGTNASGFNALPAGYRNQDGSFPFLGSYTYLLSSTVDNGDLVWRRSLRYNSAAIVRDDGYMYHGFSVRCLKDN